MVVCESFRGGRSHNYGVRAITVSVVSMPMFREAKHTAVTLNQMQHRRLINEIYIIKRTDACNETHNALHINFSNC